nr:MAG TPA: tail-collar fiber protein [Caudoviricetes sp.]
MAKFPNITMTSAGLEMLARAASGQTADRFIVTKVKLGDGVSEGNIRDYTDVISPKKEVTLAAYEDKGNGTFRYTFTYNNEGVKVGFYHREIGLFAKNGDSGTEKLVGYTNAGNYAGYIDDETRIQPYTRLIINVGIGDTDNASGIVDVGNTVTIEMLDEHNNDENAHTNLIKRLFGSATATMDSVKNSVQGWCKESIASIFGIASATQTNVKNKILEYAQEQIESWLETLGIRYNIAQNGYICLGKLFGDAIIQWGLIVGSDKLVNIPTNITIKQLLYCNACDGISSFENDGIGYFLGVADVTPTNIIFRFKENPQTFRWFILSK